MPDDTTSRDALDALDALTTSPRVAAPPFAKRDRPAAKTRMGKRRPVSLAGANVSISFGTADNPEFETGRAESASNPRKIRVARNRNESPLVRLEDMGTISERQARAGHHVRMLHERVTAGGRSSSCIRERVDGGLRADGMTDSRFNASLQLSKMAAEIGAKPFRLLILVCGEGRSLNQLARDEGRRQGTVRRALLDALDLAAEWLGFGHHTGDGSRG